MNEEARLISERRLSKDGSVHVTDEVYNTLISAMGAALSVVGIVYLLVMSARAHKMQHFIGFSIYGAGLLGMFVTSALHHGIDSTVHINHLFRKLDYYAIPVKIAATFSPLCLGLLPGPSGIRILVMIWALAISSIALQLKYPSLPKWITTIIFLFMGWLGLLVIIPIYRSMGWDGVKWLMYGGIFYTVGACIFFFEWPNPIKGKFGFHEIWHLFVFAGAASHFAQMLFVVYPAP